MGNNNKEEDKVSSPSMENVTKVTPAGTEISAEVDQKTPAGTEISEEVDQKPKIIGEEHLETAVNARLHIRFPSCQLIFVVMGFFGFIMVYALRVDMSVALVAMVNATYVKMVSQNTTVASGEDVCRTNKSSKPAPPKFPGTYNFDSEQQNLVTAAFFYGYLVFQVPGGTFAQKFGGKIILTGSMFVTSVFTVLTPLLAESGGLGGLIAARILEGLAQGVSYPSMHVLMSKWTTPHEGSKIVTFIYAGSKLGIVITNPVSGVLCDAVGWESVFYVFGGAGALWCLFSTFLMYDSPSEHPRISPEERLYIVTSQGIKPTKGTLQVPWLEIAKSPPVHALVIAHFVYNWGNFTFLVTLPQYFKFILGFDIKKNGLLSGVPYLVMWICMILTGVTCDYMRSHSIMSVTNIRKFMISFSFIGAAAFILGTGFVACDNALAVSLISISVGLTGISWGGWSVNQLDLAPPYAGTLMGITNGLSTIAGMIGPSVVGALTKRDQSRAAWRKFFYITAALYVFGSIIYIVFGSAERQKWGYEPSSDTTNTETAKKRESKSENLP